MATLAQLLAHHRCILVVDASSTHIQTGLLRAGLPPVWRSAGGEAGQLVFQQAGACLQEAGIRLDDVGAFIFCEGPGSMLGIRTVAMALRTWQALHPRPAYCFQSLALLAHSLALAGSPRPFTLIADARRDTWHAVTVDSSGTVAPLLRVPSSTLASGTEPLWQPSLFRAWAPAPRPTQDCPYQLPDLFARHAELDLFKETSLPDAFQHEAPEYKRWSAGVHSAASVRTAR
jgi:tRNA threonylcarbamoyladenosine biosynthesis protein TsaB